MKKMNLMLVLLALLVLAGSCGGEKTKKAKPTPPKKEVAKVETPKADEKVVEEEEKEEAPKEEVAEVIPIPPEQIEKAKEIIASVSDDEVEAVDAKAKFKMLCAACHGFTGDLNINGAKDLTASTLALEESVAQVYHGRGLMTPFKGILSDAEIVAVAKYIEKELRK